MNRSTRGSAPTEHGTSPTHASTHAPKSPGGSLKKPPTGSCSGTHASKSNSSTPTSTHDETLPRLRHPHQRQPLPRTRRTKKGHPSTGAEHPPRTKGGPLQIRGGASGKGGEGQGHRNRLLALRRRPNTQRPMASRPHPTGGSFFRWRGASTRTPLLQHPTPTPHRPRLGTRTHRRTPPTPPTRTTRHHDKGRGGRGTLPTPVAV